MNGENPREDWVNETSSFLLAGNLRSFDSWVDYAPGHYIEELIEKVIKKGIHAVCEPVSQAESNAAAYIIRVLTIIEKYGPINVTSIVKKSGLSNNSVNRSLNLLIKKNIIHFKQRKYKLNNEKLFAADKSLSMSYKKNLLLWKGIPDSVLFSKYIRNSTISQMALVKYFTHEKLALKINLTKKMKEKIHTNKNMILIRNLPRKYMLKILKEYVNGVYCFDCFNHGNLVKWMYTKEGSICPSCGVPQDDRYLYPIRPKFFKINQSRLRYLISKYSVK